MRLKQPLLGAMLVALVCLAAAAGALRSRKSATAESRHIERVYNSKSGRLEVMKFASKPNGKVDTWAFMDGVRVLRIEIDRDGDGVVDRWEYYGPDQKLQRVGLSSANDGKVDTWAYPGPDGQTARIQRASRRDGKITRTEFYDRGALVRAEEDTDGDGNVDKWETYASWGLASVAFDTRHRGKPDRRLVYSAGGSLERIETEPAGH